MFFPLGFLDHDPEMVHHISASLLHVHRQQKNLLGLGQDKRLEKLIDAGEGGEGGELLKNKFVNVVEDEIFEYGDALTSVLLVYGARMLGRQLVQKL